MVVCMRGQQAHVNLRVQLSQDEHLRLKLRAAQNKMSQAAYVRMLVAKDYGDYKAQEQRDREFFLGESSGRTEHE
jgi:hypothetical protein